MMAICGGAVSIVAVALLPLAGGFWLLLSAYLAFTLGQAFGIPPANAYVVREGRIYGMGASMTMFMLAMHAGNGIGPISSGEALRMGLASSPHSMPPPFAWQPESRSLPGWYAALQRAGCLNAPAFLGIVISFPDSEDKVTPETATEKSTRRTRGKNSFSVLRVYFSVLDGLKLNRKLILLIDSTQQHTITQAIQNRHPDYKQAGVGIAIGCRFDFDDRLRYRFRTPSL